MENLTFADINELADFAYTKAQELDDIGCVQVVGFYDEISEVLKEILKYDDICIRNIELAQSDLNGYFREFFLTIDDKMKVSVEPAYYNEKELYLCYDAETLIIGGDCNSIIIKKNMCDESETYFYEYEDYEDECCNCCNSEDGDNDSDSGEYTHISRDKNGTVTGFSKSWNDEYKGMNYYSSYSHYSNDENSVKRLAREFGIDL